MRIFLFGRMHVTGPGGEEIDLADRSRLLLAVVAVAPGQTIPRPVLAAALWPDLGPVAAARVLATALRQLSHDLYRAGLQPENCLRMTNKTVALRPALWCDAAVLDAALLPLAQASPGPLAATIAAPLAEAVALATGPLLLGFDDPWSERTRRVYSERLRAGLAALLQAAVFEERWSDAIICGEQLLAIDPLLEPVHAAMMRSHWRAGDARSAMRQYARLSDTLRYRCGTEPAEETTQLYDRILAEAAGGAFPRAARV